MMRAADAPQHTGPMISGLAYMIDFRRVLAARAFLAVKDSPSTNRIAGKNGVSNSTPARRQWNGTPTRVHKPQPYRCPDTGEV